MQTHGAATGCESAGGAAAHGRAVPAVGDPQGSRLSRLVSTLSERGLPYPEVWAAAAIAIEVLAPIALIAGILPRTTGLALIAFVIAATATSHRFWEFPEAARRFQEISFFKNIGLIGGLFFYVASGPGAWSWGRTRRTESVAAEKAA